jgi:hypothetical protein
VTQNVRALKITVIALGVLLVLGFIALVVGLVLEFTGPGAETANEAGSEAVAPAGPLPDVAHLALAPDAAIERMALDGSRVALQIRDGVGMRIILVDLRHGRVIGELRLTAAGPAP